MSKSITGTVTHTVVLGKHGYGSTLDIYSAGVVLPGAGKAGVVVPQSVQNADIRNYGQVFGGAGVSGRGGEGGAGVLGRGGGLIVNGGSFTGGAGGYDSARGGLGGVGVQTGSGIYLLNGGHISGGTGGNA